MTDPPIRASTMGFHDGIVSQTVLLMSLIASGTPIDIAIHASLAATLAGAVSMSLSEYQSVHTARANDIRHESPTQSAVSSFVSFVLGSCIPILIVSMGGRLPELVLGIFGTLSLTSWTAGADVVRSLTITTIALVASTVFGLVHTHH